MSDEMILFTRTLDLLDWLLPKAEDFPKVYRSTMTQRMMDAALDFQEFLIEAYNQGGTTRQKHLRSASAALDKLRLYLRLAYRKHWFSNGQYEHVSRMIAEIGRLLGGWIKQTNG
jgi:hypothetical protein